MIVFEIVNDEWARSVHQHKSRQKKGAHYVVFRSIKGNKKLYGLEELRFYLNQQGLDYEFLKSVKFQNDRDHDVVSNKVGANKIAKEKAKKWIKSNYM